MQLRDAWCRPQLVCVKEARTLNGPVLNPRHTIGVHGAHFHRDRLRMSTRAHVSVVRARPSACRVPPLLQRYARSEEHTSELQSRGHLVCRLLLEKKKK